MQRVINFSGGKTSAYMTIQEYKPGDIVLFCDTMREHPKTYKFINDFEAFENIPVTRISYEGGFEGMLKKHKALPNQFKRFCTIELKIKTAKRYLRSIGVREFENLVGFRYDEPMRVNRRTQRFKKVHDKFPLFDNKVTKQMVNEYWANKPYTLEIPSILGNCTLCFMKGKNAILAILREYPELANEWIEDEKRSKYTYLNGVTIETLKSIAQNNLFKEFDLDNINPAYDCACTT